MIGVSAPGISASYGYDADGRRVKQTVGSAVTNYLWDEASPYGDVVLETNSSGAVLARYNLAGTEMISQTRGSTTSYYLHDGQGSTRGLTSSSGAVTDTYSYKAFGEIQDQSGTTANSYLYTGQQFDSATGLYNMRARYYAPGQGRFLSQDAYPYNLGNPIELNRYSYAASSPINYSDPTGYSVFVDYAISMGVGAVTVGALVGFSDLAIQAYTKGINNIDLMQTLRFTIAGAIVGAIIGLTWPVLVAMSPDSFLDLASLGFNLATGNWAAVKWDIASLLLPGVFGLGYADEAYGALRGYNSLDNAYDITRSMERGTFDELPSGHAFDFEGFPKENLRPYDPADLLVGQKKTYSCVAAACRMILNDPSIREIFIRNQLGMSRSGSHIWEATKVLNDYLYIEDGPIYPQLIKGLQKGPAIISVQTPVTAAFTDRFVPHAVVVDAVEIDAGGGHWLSIRDPLPTGGAAYKIKVGGVFWDIYWVSDKGIVIKR